MRLESLKISILGYGNQGRAQALNLRDSGYLPLIGARPNGSSGARATEDGFQVVAVEEAVNSADLLLFLLPDEVIPEIHDSIRPILEKRSRWIAFAHAYSLHYETFQRVDSCDYLLLAPRGPGAVLRSRYLEGKKIPGAYACAELDHELCRDYMRAIGADSPLLETSFKEETLCDLFGEQAVLCGGLMALMESAFDLACKKGLKPEMAFVETCFEVKTIIELFLRFGPSEMANRISPTALYGGTAVQSEFRRALEPLLEKIYLRLEDGEFAKDWALETASGKPTNRKEKIRLAQSNLQKTFEKIGRELPKEN